MVSCYIIEYIAIYNNYVTNKSQIASYYAEVFDKYMIEVQDHKKFATDEPEPKKQRVYLWQTFNDQEQGL